MSAAHPSTPHFRLDFASAQPAGFATRSARFPGSHATSRPFSRALDAMTQRFGIVLGPADERKERTRALRGHEATPPRASGIVRTLD